MSRNLTALAFRSMKSRRGSTRSPISIEKISSAAAASSIETRCRIRFSGFMVVSHSWSGFISPSPLKRCRLSPSLARSRIVGRSSSNVPTSTVRLPIRATKGGLPIASVSFSWAARRLR